MVHYYNKFIPQTAALLAPLYELLEKDHPWLWNEECDKTFQKCKHLLTGKAILVHYDTKKTMYSNYHVMHPNTDWGQYYHM